MKKLKVIITGATGMVGEGVLQECISNLLVEKILLINRKPSGYSHAKIEEILHQDFNDLSPIANNLSGYDACYFCAGVSAVGMDEEKYRAITYSTTMGFASVLSQISPQMVFCYVSGAGTDTTENGKQMWARIKGMTENHLMELPFQAVYNFRPAFMKPSKGAKNVKGFYKAVNLLFPLFRLFNKTYFLTLAEVGKAMINVSLIGYKKHIIEVKDISELSKR